MSPRGTAHGVPLRKREHQRKNGHGPIGHRRGGDHAWFIAYAPSDAPSLAMGILVEHALHGATAAAPIAKTVAEVLFNKEKQKKR